MLQLEVRYERQRVDSQHLSHFGTRVQGRGAVEPAKDSVCTKLTKHGDAKPITLRDIEKWNIRVPKGHSWQTKVKNGQPTIEECKDTELEIARKSMLDPST